MQTKPKGKIMKKAVLLIVLLCVAIFSVFVIKYRQSTRLTMIQTVVQNNLDNAVTKYKAENAIGILIESKTGKIIVKYETSSKNAIFNQKYEFGALTGLMNTAIALENDIPIDKTYDNKTVKEIALETINSGYYKMVADLPESAQSKFFDKIHFNDVLTVNSEKTVKPDLPTEWTKSEREKASLGYGVKITPIHLITGMNAIINDGIYVFPNQRSERVISSKTSTAICEIMRETVQTTFIDKSADINQKVGIKTASIETKDQGKITTAVFATFPIEKPEYSLLVILDNPHATEYTNGWKTASVNAVPLTGQILTEIMQILEK